MFGKLKEKLGKWFKTSRETIEETAPKEKITKSEDSAKKDVKTKDAVEILSEKTPEKVVETLEEKESPEKVKQKIKKIKQEEISKSKEISSKKPSDVLNADKLIEKAKTQEIPETPVKFNAGKQKYEPDIEKITKSVNLAKKQSSDSDESEITIQKKGFFKRIKSTFSYQITEDGFNEIFDDLEMLLLENNVALEVVEDIKSKLSKKLIGKEILKQDLEQKIKKELKNSLNEILIEPDNPLEFIREKSEKPFVILFFGINGTGKTTSISKIAYFLKNAGFKIVLAAGDTFRAASIEQISEHAEKLGIPLIKHDYGSDPSAVAFDAIKYAKNHNLDVVLIDTAGRMHTKSNLIAEMEKICRVTEPDLKIFVAESIAGNDATEQAKAFNNAINIDGSILSKADIDEKGGTIISVSHATNKPIFYLGTGQEYKDLELFNKQKFIESLGL